MPVLPTLVLPCRVRRFRDCDPRDRVRPTVKLLLVRHQCTRAGPSHVLPAAGRPLPPVVPARCSAARLRLFFLYGEAPQTSFAELFADKDVRFVDLATLLAASPPPPELLDLPDDPESTAGVLIFQFWAATLAPSLVHYGIHRSRWVYHAGLTPLPAAANHYNQHARHKHKQHLDI